MKIADSSQQFEGGSASRILGERSVALEKIIRAAGLFSVNPCVKPSSTPKFMKITTLNGFVAAGLLAVTAQTALCQGTIYTSRSAFEATLSSSTTITFEDQTNVISNGTPAYSRTISGVTFTTPDALLFITGPGGGPIPGTGRYLWHFDGGYPVGILLPGGVTAFGADFSGGIEPNPSFDGTLTVNLAGGPSYTYNFSAARGSWTFWGVSFAQPIASLVYRNAGPPDGQLGGPLHEEMLDNVTFSTIPEPSVLGLLALGGTFLGWRWRLKKSERQPIEVLCATYLKNSTEAGRVVFPTPASLIPG